MMRSLFAGVSGLKTHQTRMDVIGNNIANVNTVGYKASRVTFKEMLSQQIQGATAPTETRGGTNPQQVGLGVTLGSIDVRHSQGNTQATGYITDLAIEGDGFFILGYGSQRFYTRAGAFGLDNGTDGNLVSLINGARVLGYKADANGNVDLNAPIEPLYISTSETIRPRATTQVIFAGNLDNRTAQNSTISRSVQVYDSRGREQTIEVSFTAAGDNKWNWKASWLLDSTPFAPGGLDHMVVGGEYRVESVENDLKLFYLATNESGNEVKHEVGTSVDGPNKGRVWTIGTGDNAVTIEFEKALAHGSELEAVGSGSEMRFTMKEQLAADTITFNSDGTFSMAPNAVVTLDPALADNMTVELDFTKFTHYADTMTAKFLSQNGYTNGTLESFSIDQNGRIVGSFSNGLTRTLGQVALARFTNPAGLERSDSTMFVESANSGQAQIGAAGVPGFGSISPSSLEMSNVDLSEEFTDMIITQRGFQANSRIITSSDEMLQELVNLKR